MIILIALLKNVQRKITWFCFFLLACYPFESFLKSPSLDRRSYSQKNTWQKGDANVTLHIRKQQRTGMLMHFFSFQDRCNS